MRRTILLLIMGVVLDGCSSPDEFSTCVRKCMALDDPLPASECIRICEHRLEGGEQATEGGE